MATIDVDLDVFSTEEILGELIGRLKHYKLSDSEKHRIITKVASAAAIASLSTTTKTRTQQDDLKEDALREIGDKFTVQQLWQIQEQGHC